MPAIIRFSKKELIELIEVTEAAGSDATELRSLLAEFEQEERLENPARREIPPEARPGGMTDEEYVEALRQQSVIEQGKDLECMICHGKFDHLLSGTCEDCFRKWVLSVKRR
ncbi:hypothetical protein ES703_99497 [subsurface metagenome]